MYMHAHIYAYVHAQVENAYILANDSGRPVREDRDFSS